MARTGTRPRRPKRTARRHDRGQIFARLLCLFFACVGAIPLAGGLILQSAPIQRWAAAETSRLLREELGLEATFNVELSLIPLRLAVTDLVVPSTDGHEPALQTRLTAISPRFFSLLAGRIDVGDIELEDTQLRLRIDGGQIQNLALRLPESDKSEKKKFEFKRSPFRSLTIKNTQLDLELDGFRIQTDAIDLDAFAEPDFSLDLALQIAGATFSRARETPTGLHFDEDRLCRFELRASLSREQILVRRLSLLGALDSQAALSTAPDCPAAGPDQVALRLSQVRITPQETGLPHIRGRVFLRAPGALANRLVDLPPFLGWAGFSGEILLDGKSRLPEVQGHLSGENLKLGDYVISKRMHGQVLLSDDKVRIPHLEAEWGNGHTVISNLLFEPFTEGLPLSIEHIDSRNIDFPGLMRDIDVTDQTIVDWNYDWVDIRQFRGTLSPFTLEGQISSQTSNFAVYNAAYSSPHKKRMIGVPQAFIAGSFRAHSQALEFHSTQTKFGKSSLPIKLLSLGLKGSKSPFSLTMEEGAVLDLADVGPIAGLDIQGRAQLDIALQGRMGHPELRGNVSVQGFSLGGFEAGDLEQGEVYFEPLFVDFKNLQGKRGGMRFTLPSARLDFGGDATVEFAAAVQSPAFVLREFFEIFHFDEDPRFAGFEGEGSTQAEVRYVLGGPEDPCDSGRLTVQGQLALESLQFFGEKFSGSEGEFSFDWFDMEAGLRGFHLDVPSLSLRKGSGSVFGTAQVRSGGRIQGHLLGTRVPLSRLDLFGDFFAQTDGFVTGSARLLGSLERLEIQSDLQISELKADPVVLPPSQLQLSWLPAREPLPTSGKVSACGRALAPPFDPTAPPRNETDEIHVSGSLLAGQIRLEDLTWERGLTPKLRGGVQLSRLDIPALLRFLPPALLPATLPDGHISGRLDLKEVFLERPFDSQAQFTLDQAELRLGSLAARLTEGPSVWTVHDGAVQTPALTLALQAADGPEALLDVQASVDRKQNLEAELRLRNTSLEALGSSFPGIERAEGQLAFGASVRGTLSEPELRGTLALTEGRVFLSAFAAPLTQVQLRIDATSQGLHIAQGEARWGGGTVQISGNTPLSRGELGTTRLEIHSQQVSLPLDDEVRVVFDTDLQLEIPSPQSESEKLPRLTGQVLLQNASYERPMAITADLASLTGRGKKTEVDTYHAEKDKLELDILLRAQRPLTVKNALVEASLEIDPSGLRISGTNQRFGAMGNVEVTPGGRIFLRRNAFEVQSGLVRFNDPTRLHPQVDVTARTEFRRFEDRGATQAGVHAAASAGTPVAGNWRILLRAYGPPDDLRIDLTSDPPLGQDDIFLLLTVGLTRTELDQTRSSGVGNSLALEALGTLSGAESAITDTVPIDEFRFGSMYSARSGRTEPTVTIGKRLSDRIRASITTSLSDTNEVRSNIEYRATQKLSVEGSYDNAQRAGAPAIGNLGGDVRFRLEFN